MPHFFAQGQASLLVASGGALLLGAAVVASWADSHAVVVVVYLADAADAESF